MRPDVGVIGGMGPDAAILFLHTLTGMTMVASDQDHLDVELLQHCSIPDRTAYILDHTQPNPVVPILDDVRELNRRQVQVIAIPCNTAHFFFDEISAASEAPVLNMIDLTAAHVAELVPPGSSVGVLGTRGTISSGLYQHALEAVGLHALNPSEAVQHDVDTLIFDQVKANQPLDRDLYMSVLERTMQAGAQIALIGCTELSVPEHAFAHDYASVDALDVLARATIVRAGGTLKL